MNNKFLSGLLLCVVLTLHLSGKEGMWVPVWLEKYNIEEMQQMGFKLTAKDIYDVNNSSMKDAVVIFGSGCTGEMISDEGLLITNHHCGYRQIQAHSTVENDYLTNGFWAMSREEELPNPGLSVRFLEYMKDVTAEVLQETAGLDEKEREKKIRQNMAVVEKEAAKEGKFSTQVKPLFYGNQYFLYVYTIFRDVRLVGAPPSAIGKFGGDTDNWMWPRHTGDFSLFRIYADENNEPASYSPENVPYKPKKFFPISIAGVQPGDFTMVFGNPGSTQQYIPAEEVDIIMNQRDPDRIAIRGKKLEIIGAAMASDSKVRIQYAAKYAGISNSWKKWQGEILGLERLNAVETKKAFEAGFKNRAQSNGTWETTYRPIFNNFNEIYAEYSSYIKAYDYYSEIVSGGVEVFRIAALISPIINSIENNKTERLEHQRKAVLQYIKIFERDFHQPVDEQLFMTLIPVLGNDLGNRFLPAGFTQTLEKFEGEKLLKKVYHKSVLSDLEKLKELLEKGSEKKLQKLRNDPLISMFKSLDFYYTVQIKPMVIKLNEAIDHNMKIYMAGIMEMQKNEPLYPDANLTLRVTYGKVQGYEPRDGVKYKYYTTLSGMMEKDNPAIYDYDVPEKLKEIYYTKDFGEYGVAGEMPVCFIASNHTTGGNSGSPVVNARGELIGVNFDRNWEGTMSDIMYDPDLCRNIAIDIRYALFIIDKFAGAGYLLDEMEIVE
ncbi:MAG: S46 family peptidase [Prolixibacteraceae bacterium]